MDILSSPVIIGASLVGIGFFTGLSGAMIPGPMLAYVVSDTLKKGAISGPLTVLGHIFVEFSLIVALVVVGFELMKSYITQFESLLYAIGGVALIVMSVLIIRERKGEQSPSNHETFERQVKLRGATRPYNSSIVGGVLFTAFNPAFPFWWVFVGFPLLLQGFEWLAFAGIVLVTFGHSLSDLAWYSFVSYSFARGKNFLVGKRYEVLMLVLALFVTSLGVFFFIKGVTGLF
jgi:threonine/homoserine/homoserine lactone efflux protein